MFVFAFLIGIYSHLIFFLGLEGILYKNIVIGLTVAFWGAVFICRIRSIREIREFKSSKNKLFLFFLALFILQVLLNFIGVLGPERGFDALWYHLTLPKLYLLNHSIFFIPGGLLYYSA